MNTSNENLPEAPLMSHLLELRTRLLRVVICVVIVAIPCVYFANDLFEFLSAPLIAKLPADGQVIATGVTSGFMAPFKLAIFVAVFISIPYALHQAWAFVAPGLYGTEKRFAIPLLVSSVVLFYVGILFAYTLVFPAMFAFFAQSAPEGVTMMTANRAYVLLGSFVIAALLTPADAISMCMMAVPMYLLYEAGLLIVQMLVRSRPEPTTDA